MEEERLMILQLAAEKKITPEEATELLRALDATREVGESERPVTPGADPDELRRPEPPRSGFWDAIGQLLDFGLGRGPQREVRDERTGDLPEGDVLLQVNVGNGTLKLNVWDQPGYRLLAERWVRADHDEAARRLHEEHPLLRQEGNRLLVETHRHVDVKLRLELWLPKDRLYDLDARLGNGTFSAQDLPFMHCRAALGNGTVEVALRGEGGGQLDANTGNGTVRVDTAGLSGQPA